MKVTPKALSLLMFCCIVIVGCNDDDDDNLPTFSSSSESTSSISSVSTSSTTSESSSSRATITSVRDGFLSLTDAGDVLYDNFSAQAQLIVTDESSKIEVYASGLTADTEYAAHVHNGYCAEGGGPHYLQDPNGEDIAENGLWPSITVEAGGQGYGMASQDFVVTEEARSVVIHEPGSGARIACGDLIASGGTTGEFSLTEAGRALYDELTATGYLSVRTNAMSKAEIEADGLTSATTYGAHVHVGECATGGAGHYLQDTTGDDVAENGLWPIIEVDAWGYGLGWAVNPFTVRLADAKSMVIHQPSEGTRIACADLDKELLAFRSGNFMTTDDGAALYGELVGWAKLVITANGESKASVYLTGLNAATEYASHVHNGACENGGGAHYLQDPAGADVAINGLWPGFTTDENGVGRGIAEQDFTVRPDARSVVVHEPGSGAGIACADLN